MDTALSQSKARGPAKALLCRGALGQLHVISQSRVTGTAAAAPLPHSRATRTPRASRTMRQSGPDASRATAMVTPPASWNSALPRSHPSVSLPCGCGPLSANALAERKQHGSTQAVSQKFGFASNGSDGTHWTSESAATIRAKCSHAGSKQAIWKIVGSLAGRCHLRQQQRMRTVTREKRDAGGSLTHGVLGSWPCLADSQLRVASQTPGGCPRYQLPPDTHCVRSIRVVVVAWCAGRWACWMSGQRPRAVALQLCGTWGETLGEELGVPGASSCRSASIAASAASTSARVRPEPPETARPATEVSAPTPPASLSARSVSSRSPRSLASGCRIEPAGMQAAVPHTHLLSICI